MSHRLPSQERLDAWYVVSWTSATLGDLPSTIEAADAAMGSVDPGQNPAFALGAAAWRAYAYGLVGDWDEVAASVERERQLWIESDRPSAGYGLQGLLTGLDFARSRADEARLERWYEVAADIVGRFDREHPTASLAALIELRMDDVATTIMQAERYPYRLHYIEHAMALCADRAQPVPSDAIAALVAHAERAGMRVVEAQARRLLGVLTDDGAELERSLALFETIGADRYAARARAELGLVGGDSRLVDAGLAALDRMGEVAQLERIEARRRPGD
jgi:hypothetical protein